MILNITLTSTSWINQILYSLLIQVVFSLGFFMAIALIIAITNKISSKLLSSGAYIAYNVTGFVGTPIHELGHAFFCVIFGHKIDDIKLYDFHPDDDCLGYVNHSYNSRNIYHVIGNFFISFGPIFFGVAVIYGLLYLLCGNVALEISENISDMKNLSFATLDISIIEKVLVINLNNLKDIFNVSNLSSYKWWIFIVLSTMIAMHMKLSAADLKGMIPSVFIIMFFLLIINIVVRFFGANALNSYNELLIMIFSYIFCFLCISLIFSLITIIISLFIALIRKIFKR